MEGVSDTMHVIQRYGSICLFIGLQFTFCSSIPVDLQSWKEKIEINMTLDESTTEDEGGVRMEEGDGSYQTHEEFRDGVLTIGCCGK